MSPPPPPKEGGGVRPYSPKGELLKTIPRTYKS